MADNFDITKVPGFEPATPETDDTFDLSSVAGFEPVEQTQQEFSLNSVPGFEPAEPEETSVIEDIGKGLQRSIAPTTMTREELRKKTSWTEFGSQIVGDVASSVAAMKAGAVIGGTVAGPAGAATGAISGAVLYGIYKGTAEESALAAAQDRDFDPISAALGASVEIIPSTPGSRVLKAAMQSVAASGDTYYKGGSKEQAIVAGLLGGGLTALTAGPKANPKTLQKANERITEESDEMLPELMVRANDFYEEIEPLDLSFDIKKLKQTLDSSAHLTADDAKAMKDQLTIDDANFIRHVIGKSSASLNENDLRKFQKKVKPEGELDQHWDHYKRVKSAEKAGVEYAEAIDADITGIKPEDPNSINSVGRIFRRKLRSASHTARRIDDEIGTDFEGVINQFAKAEHYSKMAAVTYQNRIRKIQRSLSKSEKEAVAKEMKEGLSGKNEAANELRAIYDEVRERAILEGKDVKYLEDYFPNYTKSAPELHVALKNRWEDIKKTLDPDQLKDARDLREIATSDEAKELWEVLENYRVQTKKDPNEVIKFSDVEDLIESAIAPKGKGTKGTPELGIMFERHGTVPEFIRENDPIKATYRYVRSTMNQLHNEQAFKDLDVQLAMARGAGMDSSVLYFENFKRLMSGNPSEFISKINSTANRFKAKGLLQQQLDGDGPLTGKWNRLSGRSKELASDVLGWNLAQAYPNLLGWDVYAPLRNMTQTWLLTAPTLAQKGSKLEGYAHSLTARGWKDMLGAKRKGINLEQDLVDRGLASSQHFSEGVETIIEGLESSKLSIPVRAIQSLGEAGMYLYGKSDVVNRFITMRIGKNLADDLAKGTKEAQEIVNGFPRSVQLKLKMGKEPPEKILGEYLVSSTQFNYGRADLNEFGKEYGRLFTMFTKWPVMIGGDIEDIYRAQNKIQASSKFARKYGSRLGLLWAADSLMEDNVLDSSAGRVLLNKGVMKASPIMAVTALPTPLWWDTLGSVFNVASQAIQDPNNTLDPDWWENNMWNMLEKARPIIPGEVLYRAPEKLNKRIEGE